MDYIDKKAKDNTMYRVLQALSLVITFFLSSFYINRAAVLEISYMLGGEIDEQFILFTMILSSVLVVGLYYLGLKIIYNIADGIYKRHIIKSVANREDLHNSVASVLTFPIDYDTFKWEVSWYAVAINTMVALARLLYFYYPFTFGIVEAVVPIVINLSLMSLYYIRLRIKHLNDNNKGIVFASLIVPYSVFLMIFV